MTLDIFNLADDQPWMTAPGRPCATGDPERFFDERQAASLCEGCSVAASCLTFALEFRDPGSGSWLQGTWGGTTERQRSDVRTKSRRKRVGATKCLRGHLRTDENTYIDKRGRKFCRVCTRLTKNRRAAEQRAALNNAA